MTKTTIRCEVSPGEFKEDVLFTTKSHIDLLLSGVEVADKFGHGILDRYEKKWGKGGFAAGAGHDGLDYILETPK